MNQKRMKEELKERNKGRQLERKCNENKKREWNLESENRKKERKERINE